MGLITEEEQKALLFFKTFRILAEQTTTEVKKAHSNFPFFISTQFFSRTAIRIFISLSYASSTENVKWFGGR